MTSPLPVSTPKGLNKPPIELFYEAGLAFIPPNKVALLLEEGGALIPEDGAPPNILGVLNPPDDNKPEGFSLPPRTKLSSP